MGNNCRARKCPRRVELTKENGIKNSEAHEQKYLRFLPHASLDTMPQEQKKIYLAYNREVKKIDVPKQSNQLKPLASQYGM